MVEAAAGDITIAGARTIILTAPAGFEFNTEATVTAFVSGLATKLTLDSYTTTPTANTITFTVAAISVTNPSTVFFSNIQVRPTNCAAGTTGNLSFSGDAGVVGNAGVLTVVHGVAAKLNFDTPPSASVKAGAVIATQPIVHLLDQKNNLITSGTVGSVTIASFSDDTCTTPRAGLTGTTVEAVAGTGIADFAGNALASTLAGANLYLKASSSLGESITTACLASAVTVTPNDAHHLHFSTTPATTSYMYVPFATQPTVVVRDQYNNVTADTDVVTLLVDPTDNTCAAAVTTNLGGTRTAAAGTAYTNLQYNAVDTSGVYLCAAANVAPTGAIAGVSSRINVYSHSGQTVTTSGTTATTTPTTTAPAQTTTTTTTTPAPAVTTMPQPAKPIAEMNQAEKNTYTMQLQQFLIQLLTQLLTLLKK